MEKLNATASLEKLILVKETEYEVERKLLIAHFQQTYESLKLSNIIKGTIQGVVSLPSLKGNIVNAAVGFVSGFVLKKLFNIKSQGLISKLLRLNK